MGVWIVEFNWVGFVTNSDYLIFEKLDWLGRGCAGRVWLGDRGSCGEIIRGVKIFSAN